MVDSRIQIRFCPRAEPVSKDRPSALSDICMTRNQWREIAVRFCVQNSLIEAIGRRTTSITTESHRLNDGDFYGGTGDTLQLCTVTIPLDNGFAVSAVHFEHSNLTLAVVLGATKHQVNRTQTLLTDTPEAISEPLLILGLSTELALDLLTQSVKDNRESCSCMARILSLSTANIGSDSTVSMNFAADFPTGLRAISSENARLSEELKAFKEALVQALEFYSRFGDNVDNQAQGMSATNGRITREQSIRDKMRDRFWAILAELDSLISLSRLSVDELSQMSQEAASISNRVSTSGRLSCVL